MPNICSSSGNTRALQCITGNPHKPFHLISETHYTELGTIFKQLLVHNQCSESTFPRKSKYLSFRELKFCLGKKSFQIYSYISLCVCAHIHVPDYWGGECTHTFGYVHKCRCLQMPEALDPLKLELWVVYELPGCWKLNLVLWENSRCSQLVSHLSSPL